MRGEELASDGADGAGRHLKRRPTLHPAAHDSAGPCLWPRQQARSVPMGPCERQGLSAVRYQRRCVQAAQGRAPAQWWAAAGRVLGRWRT